MNNPEGYVLVQVKQLAQWREWANNVAAWSTKADRSSEVARLKASISSAMISATQPTASNAGERVPAGWSISIGDNGEVLVSAPGCEPGAAWIKNQGPLSQRLLYALASALASKPPAGEQKT